MYEQGTLKPVEAILRRGRGKRENNGGNEPSWVQYMYIWKCNNEIPCITIIY
jgi:hypothetical protein